MRSDTHQTTRPDELALHASRLASAGASWPIDPARAEEHAALVALLVANRSGRNPLTEPLANAIAAASLQPGHLWRALELPDRSLLRELLTSYYAPLALQNTKDMRWKRFFYKRLCGWEGFQH